jgi:hypothetical protein
MKIRTRSNKRKILYVFFAMVIALTTFIVQPTDEVGAAVWSDRCYVAGWPGSVPAMRSCSYFDNGWLRSYGNAYVLSGGISSTNVTDFINTLKAHNRGSDIQNKAGSAFIAHSMLGRSGPQANANGGRTVSNSDFEILRQRLNASTIEWNVNACSDGINTMAVTSRSLVDVMRNPNVNENDKCEKSIVVNDGNGGVYKIFRRCANPVGAMKAINPVVLDYTLNPVMSVNPDSAEGGSTATLSPSVDNTGSTDSPADVAWQITNFNVARGGTVPDGGSNAQAPTTHYGNGASVIQPGSGVFRRGGVTSITANPHTMADEEVGTRICYALSVSPYNQSTGTNWRHSTPDCVTIAKKPKVQVLGSDLIVGKGQTSNIVTSSTTKGIGGSNQTFGSWGEYGIIASGRVTSMASGAGYSGGATSNVFCGVSLLTFSNVNTGQTSCSSASQMGGYANTKSLPDVGSRLNTSSSLGVSPTVNLASISTGSYAATGNVRVSASGPIVSGKWVVINAPTATVTINSDINYTTGTLDSLGDIPQVVIIANQIRIAGSVTNIDAWLIASGTAGNLFTCSDVATASELRSGNCDQRLTVNGPVMAKHLYLYRTAGAGTGNQTGDPAEVFNLRPDAYLWATGYLSDDGRLQTVTTKELPPRF